MKPFFKMIDLTDILSKRNILCNYFCSNVQKMVHLWSLVEIEDSLLANCHLAKITQRFNLKLDFYLIYHKKVNFEERF